jgi:hypothetical protein
MRDKDRRTRRSSRGSGEPDEHHVRCEQIDALTDIIAVDGELTDRRLEGLRGQLTDSLRAGVAFVVVDLAAATPGADGVAQILADADAPLARRDGGLAVVGPSSVVRCTGVSVFSTRAEALSGVRGRLTPKRSIRSRPLRARA